MSIDLNQCDVACLGCVKSYKKKHHDDPPFRISCNGIPLEYVPKKVLAILPEQEAKSAIWMLDPVEWAANVLDWYCIDPDGAVWKRKSLENKLPQGVPNFFDPKRQEENELRARTGKSPFHRPYQATMLRCTSKRKVFRIGRQAGKTEVLVVSILHAIFTNRNFKVLLLTPFQAQIDMIFTRIAQFMTDNPMIYNSKNRMVKAPNYTLTLYNGSSMRGFTAGVQSKGNSAQVRGQTANMLVFDEADYLSPADLDSALAVITNFPDATVWMSSTPTGRREKFYDTCNSNLYKEFYYPSQVNPNWTEELEVLYRSTLTEAGYRHEVLAEFGDIQEGVFAAGHVDTAKSVKYRYDQMKRERDWRYCIGVDWNDVKIGTTICVTGWNPATNHFYVVERRVVKKEGWTQTAACEEIVKLNRKWLPDFIYVDKGYGSTQHEILRAWGYQSAAAKKSNGNKHVDSRLSRIVKSYDFASKVEIRDLFTRQPVEKDAKPFLVENAVRRFEMHQMHFSHEDKQLEAELRGYVIDRISIYGRPVYKQGNDKVGDHNLDALMLSLVAFELELTSFGKPAYTPHIGFSGNFGESTGDHPDIGGLKVENPWAKKEAGEQKRNDARPDLNRLDNFTTPDSLTPSSTSSLPIANTSKDPGAKPRIWSWPGWGHDAPPPTSKKGNWVKSVRRMMKPPSRKKF